MSALPVILLLLAFATDGARFGEPGDEAALRHLKEVAWPKAYREQDVALLDRILAKEFQMIDADGAWSDKAAELEYVRRNAPGYDSLTFHIRRLDIFENGTAVVAGTGIIRDGDEVIEYQSSNILIRREGRWQAIASHVSGVKAGVGTGKRNGMG